MVQNSTAHGWELHKMRFALFAGLRKSRKWGEMLWGPLFHIVCLFDLLRKNFEWDHQLVLVTPLVRRRLWALNSRLLLPGHFRSHDTSCLWKRTLLKSTADEIAVFEKSAFLSRHWVQWYTGKTWGQTGKPLTIVILWQNCHRTAPKCHLLFQGKWL